MKNFALFPFGDFLGWGKSADSIFDKNRLSGDSNALRGRVAQESVILMRCEVALPKNQ